MRSGSSGVARLEKPVGVQRLAAQTTNGRNATQRGMKPSFRFVSIRVHSRFTFLLFAAIN
jgi:hypothetical protein